MIELLLPRYLVPVRPRGAVWQNHAVAIKDSQICSVGPSADLIRQYPQARQVVLASHVLMPGLINMHTHSPMTLLRGYADDLRLDAWLKDHIWPAELKWADSEFVKDGTELALLEMIRGGTSCFNENYFYPDQIADASSAAGIRAFVGIPLIDFETRWAADFDQYLQRGLAVAEKHAGNPLVDFTLAPHSMYSVSNEMLSTVSAYAQEKNFLVHLHLLETEWEIEFSLKQNGAHPLQHADNIGLLNEKLLAVHMTHLSDEDIDLIGERKVNVIHCPQSNLKLASGICRLKDLLQAGVNVSLGTDGAAANNDLDLLAELQTASLLAKGATRDPCAIDSMAALDLVTICAARALGREDCLGSIEPGKQADMCALDLNHARTQPVHNVISQIVYAASGSQVTDVWIAGRRVLKDSRMISMDEEAILAKAERWAQRMHKTINPDMAGCA